MSELLLRANELCEAARRKNIVLGDADKAALRTFYDAILSEGERRHPARLKPSGKAGRVKQFVAFNLLLRLRRYADAVLLFVSDPAVPFTNNLGERAIRMPKVKQKISGSFRTLLGAQNFCVIRSCLDTLSQTRSWHARRPATRIRRKPDSASPRLNSYHFGRHDPKQNTTCRAP